MIENDSKRRPISVRSRAVVMFFSAIAAMPASALATEFKPIALRGYGTLSGTSTATAAGTVLRIDCDDADKAKLTQAKYLSDLQVLPGVKSQSIAGVTTYSIDNQGCIAAFCDQSRVTILSANTEVDLQKLIRQLKPAGPSIAQVQVPMYLDRWDRFGFRHYYIPWETPKGTKGDTYDFIKEFEWAKKEDHAGILVTETRLPIDTADEMLNTGWNDWTAHEALKYRLPVDIHDGAGAGGDPTWILNRYPDQVQQKMPGFTGNFHSLMSPYLGGQGVLSWVATTAQDDTLGLLQTAVKRFANEPNVTSYLEPHGETHHGPQDLLLEYGPVADAAYRDYLKETYGRIEKISARWAMPLNTWGDVHVPEMASFAGWGPQAMEVGNLWRLGYEELKEKIKDPSDGEGRTGLKSNPAPEAWFKPNFDDSKWPVMPGGGDDHELFLQKRPVVLRQTLVVPNAYRTKYPKLYLYEWDFNLATGGQVRTVFNGKDVGNTKIAFNAPHWSAVDVSTAVHAGGNSLVIRVPQGYLGYKIYLSPVPPKQYPDLGPALNAQWVDFIDFTQWSRVQGIRRGMEMIRQAAPNQGITMMHPDEYSDGLKSLAVAYGGEFHNTGYMGGFYADYNTTLMRGADLPYSIEPGAPFKDFDDWKKQLGLYQVEGVQAIDYFIHLGNIFWNPQVKADYELHRKQLTLMGQSHIVKAETAVLFSDRVAALTGFPWEANPETNIGTGYWQWNVGSVLRGSVPYDGLSQSSFANGEADAYRVVIDSNTSVMDPSMVADIEKWVRAGGTFVTIGQTGRHTPEQPNAWPIDRLTGYRVTKIDPVNVDQRKVNVGKLAAAAGQNVFGHDWNGVPANGLHLQKISDDTQNLLMWNDGSVAAGVRPLGKGFVVELGAKFTATSIPDRIEPMDDKAETKRSAAETRHDPAKAEHESAESLHLHQLLMAVLNWRKVAPEPGRLHVDNPYVILRHAVTNNGLYDTWTLWNQSKDDPQTATLDIAGPAPAFCVDMRNDRMTEQPISALNDIKLEPLEARVFLTPRGQIDQAPLAWFDLQRKWWRGATPPPTTPLPAPVPHLARDLTNDWKFLPMSNPSEVNSAGDDSHWATRTLGVWDVNEEGGKSIALFRKGFTVPAEWSNGRVSLWLTGWNGTSFVDQGRVWLDGNEVKQMSPAGYISESNPTLKAGTAHTLSVEVVSAGVLAGLRGSCWISFDPTPTQTISLAGQWTPSLDGLHYGAPIELPGKFNAQFLRRSIFVGDEHKSQTVEITVDGDPALICAIVNGKLYRRHHHMIGERGNLNITPMIKFGQTNDVELVRWQYPGKGVVREVSLGFFDKSPF